jgi:hypothetical protein
LEYSSERDQIEFIHQVTNYKSLRFASDWGNVGTFTIEINADKPKANEFIVGRFIQVGNEIGRQGFVSKVSRRMAVGDDGIVRNTLLVSGMQLKGLLYFTLAMPPGGVYAGGDPETGIWQWFDADGDIVDITTVDYYGTGISYDIYENVVTETIMKDIVFNNRKVNFLPFQNIPQLEIEPDYERGIIHEYESFRFKKVSDVLDYLSSASGLGWNIVIDEGKLLFKIIEGVDRSAEQSVNDRVIFAFNRGNVSRVEYVEDSMESNNQILVGGQGEGTERQLLLVGQFDKTGMNSQFGFVDARDVETLEGLETRGLQKIAERKSTQAISVTGFSKKVLVKLGTHYNLGDIVTIKIEDWNLTLHVRVTSVVERQTIDNAGTLEFEFGTKSLSLESLIRKNFSEIDNEVLK